jgi:hypothetical protein
MYRCTYLVSSGFAFAALFAGIVLHAKFVKLGGPLHYIAPE